MCNCRNVTVLKGDKGDVGPQGPQGNQGIQGIQGIQGDQGIQGIQGIQGVPGTSFTTENHFQIKQHNLGDVITPLGPANTTENDLFNITITEPGKYFISFTGDLQITLNAATQYAFNYSIIKNGSAIYTGNQLSAYTTIASLSSRNMALDEVMTLIAGDVINVVYNVLVAGNAVAVPFRRRLIAFRIE